MTELLYSELSYEVVGALFSVYNSLGYGHRERAYQGALAEEFKLRDIKFARELYYPVVYNNKVVSKYFFDFLIENKIVLETKVSNQIFEKDISQLLSYLKTKNYRLGIIAVFSKNGVIYKRIIN